MPFAIDEDKITSKPGQQNVTSLDPAKPPVKSIPHHEFPRVVYKHPKEPFLKIEHRNSHHELVNVETVPAEHLTKLVNDERELAAALKDGWVKQPYISQAPPDPNAHVFDDADAGTPSDASALIAFVMSRGYSEGAAKSIVEEHADEVRADMQHSKDEEREGDDNDVKDLEAMTKAELASYAEENCGLKLNVNSTKDALLAAIREAEGSGAKPPAAQ